MREISDETREKYKLNPTLANVSDVELQLEAESRKLVLVTVAWLEDLHNRLGRILVAVVQ